MLYIFHTNIREYHSKKLMFAVNLESLFIDHHIKIFSSRNNANFKYCNISSE